MLRSALRFSFDCQLGLHLCLRWHSVTDTGLSQLPFVEQFLCGVGILPVNAFGGSYSALQAGSLSHKEESNGQQVSIR